MSQWRYRDASARARGAIWLLCATAALNAAGAALLWARPYDTSGPVAAFWIAGSTVMIGSTIAFFFWLYRANANARALGADDMMVGPGWSVGWYFVPLANLFMPFVTMRELWKASSNPRDWQAASAPLPILLWWICWVASNLAAIIGFRLELEYAKDAFEAAQIVSLASELFSIPASLLLAWIITRIQALQRGATGPATSAVFS